MQGLGFERVLGFKFWCFGPRVSRQTAAEISMRPGPQREGGSIHTSYHPTHYLESFKVMRWVVACHLKRLESWHFQFPLHKNLCASGLLARLALKNFWCLWGVGLLASDGGVLGQARLLEGLAHVARHAFLRALWKACSLTPVLEVQG